MLRKKYEILLSRCSVISSSEYSPFNFMNALLVLVAVYILSKILTLLLQYKVEMLEILYFSKKKMILRKVMMCFS